jgi:alkylated DNA repair dioxygenase AlkB
MFRNQRFSELPRRLVCGWCQSSYQRPHQPDAALINIYEHRARLGMHPDKDERVNARLWSR